MQKIKIQYVKLTGGPQFIKITSFGWWQRKGCAPLPYTVGVPSWNCNYHCLLSPIQWYRR